MKDSFGNEVINSYLKLKKQEIKDFYIDEVFDKDKAVTQWEKNSTLDC